MGLFGLFGRKKEAEVAEEKPHPFMTDLKAGGTAAERAYDVLQSKLGSQFRAGGGKAIETFCEFYDLACGIGNSDSVDRFVARFLPLLPKSDRQIVEHRCGLDGSEGSAAFQKFKKIQGHYKAIGDVLLPGLKARVEEELEKIRERMRHGGPAARDEYFKICKRHADADNDEALQKFQREHLPLFPQADRDAILGEMLESYRESSEFLNMTKGMGEREQLRLIESIIMED